MALAHPSMGRFVEFQVEGRQEFCTPDAACPMNPRVPMHGTKLGGPDPDLVKGPWYDMNSAESIFIDRSIKMNEPALN
uniref:Uncharacterized protein n=1 Tax=Nymphaea colorata TaxID=210225 RepID=A0A5K1CY07_9MAGN